MHAYLIVGEEEESLKEAEILAKRLKLKVFEFPLQKIEDVRQLGSFVSLSLGEPTAIVSTNIDQATPEAMNAFLKNLEEPQEGLFYILTTSNLRAIVPTIVSRCQVISLVPTYGPSGQNSQMAKNFLESPVGEKLKLTSEIKDRDLAKTFVTSFILGCHSLMLGEQKEHTIYSRAIRAASFTKAALEANGQVTIQLTNLVTSLV
jgi:hypothetical protein